MKIIIIILQAILNLVRKRRDLIANRSKIPPEYRDDVVVWYSPKKQRLTNYDVIESYAEDFTYWTLDNTGITSTPKKIVIPTGTELKYVIAFRGFNSFTAGFDIKYTGNIAITYRYTKEDGTVGTIAIDKSGIYHLPASVRAQKNFGFYCNPQTVTEEATIEQLPTSILKDFSGNGLDAYMYGFQGKLNSGVGIYAVDFTTYSKTSVVTDVSHNTVKVVPAASNYLFIRYAMTEMPAYTVNVQNLGNNVLTYQYATENGRREITLTEGINELPESIKTEKDYQVGFRVNAGTGEITITQIPDYPNSLCYAGKQYCKAYGLPIFDDYTIIARRTWFDKDGVFANKGIGNDITNTAFVFENKTNNKTVIRTASFGGWNNVNIPNEGISYQTKNKYNNADITYSIGIDKSEEFAIGAYNSDNDGNFEGCHDDIIIFKRSLAINEINDITEAIFNETIIEE
jgi:hypothetical protein